MSTSIPFDECGHMSDDTHCEDCCDDRECSFHQVCPVCGEPRGMHSITLDLEHEPTDEEVRTWRPIVPGFVFIDGMGIMECKDVAVDPVAVS